MASECKRNIHCGESRRFRTPSATCMFCGLSVQVLTRVLGQLPSAFELPQLKRKTLRFVLGREAINEQGGHEFVREQGKVYGKIWREESEAGDDRVRLRPQRRKESKDPPRGGLHREKGISQRQPADGCALSKDSGTGDFPSLCLTQDCVPKDSHVTVWSYPQSV